MRRELLEGRASSSRDTTRSGFFLTVSTACHIHTVSKRGMCRTKTRRPGRTWQLSACRLNGDQCDSVFLGSSPAGKMSKPSIPCICAQSPCLRLLFPGLPGSSFAPSADSSPPTLCKPRPSEGQALPKQVKPGELAGWWAGVPRQGLAALPRVDGGLGGMLISAARSPRCPKETGTPGYVTSPKF